MNKLFYIVIFFISMLSSQEKHWNTTPFDKIWNKVVHPMMFRDPLVITPFDIRIGQFYYGGENYWNSFKLNQPFGQLIQNDNYGIKLNNQVVEFNIIDDPNNRKGIFFEIDLAKTNIPNFIYHQNVLDVQFGLGYKINQMLNDIDLPSGESGWPNQSPLTGTLKFYPIFQDYNINTSISLQRSPNYLLYLSHSMGYVQGSLYKSTGGKTFLKGNGISESFSLGLKYIGNNNNAFTFNWGLESKWGRILINELSDSHINSPITGIDIRTFGIYFTFSVNIGGISTIGDEAFRNMMKEDYINSSIQFESFLENYIKHGKKDVAENMLEFCYSQVPYQRFREGLGALKDKDYNRALKLFEKAQDDADDNLRFEIDSRLSEISNTLLDSVLNNYNIMGYNAAEKLVQRAVEISPKTRFRGDKVLAKMYFEQGNILYRIGNYEKSLEKYSFAQQLDPDMGNLLNAKRMDLALGFINDATKATDVESIYLVIESLKSAIEMQPELESEMSNILNQLEFRLEEIDRREVQKIVNEIIHSERINQLETRKPKLELGLLPHEVEFILGEPQYKDIIIDDFGVRHEMWSYEILSGSKRLYFEDFFLIKIEEDY